MQKGSCRIISVLNISYRMSDYILHLHRLGVSVTANIKKFKQIYDSMTELPQTICRCNDLKVLLLLGAKVNQNHCHCHLTRPSLELERSFTSVREFFKLVQETTNNPMNYGPK